MQSHFYEVSGQKFKIKMVMHHLPCVRHCVLRALHKLFHLHHALTFKIKYSENPIHPVRKGRHQRLFLMSQVLFLFAVIRCPEKSNLQKFISAHGSGTVHHGRIQSRRTLKELTILSTSQDTVINMFSKFSPFPHSSRPKPRGWCHPQ